jgi:histidinol-phosphatase (PHP family)
LVLKSSTFDYLVGSVHYVRLGDADILIDWERPRIDDALERAGGPERLQLAYYEHMLELVEWKLANVIGHLDLVKMLLTQEEAVRTPSIKEAVYAVLEAMRNTGVAMDVNARGLLKPCKHIYPEDWILEAARRIGVPVTLGDDSHSAADVGRNLDVAVEAIARAGYENVWLVRAGGELEPSPLPI